VALEWRPNNRSLIDVLERVLEKGLLVVSWLRPTNLTVPRPAHTRRVKARPSSHRTASRPSR